MRLRQLVLSTVLLPLGCLVPEHFIDDGSGGNQNTSNGGNGGTAGTGTSGGQNSGGNGTSGGSSGGGTSSSGGSGNSGETGGTGGGFPVTPIEDGCDGSAARYWDCCKPICAWSDNVTGSPANNCGFDGAPISQDAQDACSGGGPSHACFSLAPWAFDDQVAFGFASVPSATCGTCYQLEFTGTSNGAAGDPGAVALSGKTMFVQAVTPGARTVRSSTC